MQALGMRSGFGLWHGRQSNLCAATPVNCSAQACLTYSNSPIIFAWKPGREAWNPSKDPTGTPPRPRGCSKSPANSLTRGAGSSGVPGLAGVLLTASGLVALTGGACSGAHLPTRRAVSTLQQKGKGWREGEEAEHRAAVVSRWHRQLAGRDCDGVQ